MMPIAAGMGSQLTREKTSPDRHQEDHQVSAAGVGFEQGQQKNRDDQQIVINRPLDQKQGPPDEEQDVHRLCEFETFDQ